MLDLQRSGVGNCVTFSVQLRSATNFQTPYQRIVSTIFTKFKRRASQIDLLLRSNCIKNKGVLLTWIEHKLRNRAYGNKFLINGIIHLCWLKHSAIAVSSYIMLRALYIIIINSDDIIKVKVDRYIYNYVSN